MQYLYNLGATLLHKCYARTRNQNDVNRAVNLLQKAVALMPSNFPSRSIYIGTLAEALETRFERTENLADLERARKLRAKL